MYHSELGKSTADIWEEKQRAARIESNRRRAELTHVAQALQALLEKKEQGPYSGKSLEWWREAFITAQLSNIWFEEGDTEYLLDVVAQTTGVDLPDDEYAAWKILRIAEEVAYYQDDE